ncbi:MAG: ImmA/IrrE family metallo-endopeptidase [Candidatus Eisenbacteria bacterium]|nr:ImmA/IrrE family metallo-endopeptidase [Candidatus Eisenbacteria bacterium]
MPKPTRVPITPEVLTWAIESSGLTPPALAARLHVEASRVAEWLSGAARPTVTEFRRLAKLLRRPTATFFLNSPPSLRSPFVEFRAMPGEPAREPLPEERERIREVVRLQRSVAWLLEELGEAGPELPVVRASSNPVGAATRLRDLLGVSVEQQLSWQSEYEALRGWRDALEAAGILVFLLPMGASAARGFSVWHPSAPVIVANTHWRAAARIFTLHHELGHLATRTSSICSEQTLGSRVAEEDGGVERWCERFAAALLMPEDAVRSQLRELAALSPVTDLDTVARLARKFGVSLRAATLRLIGLQLASWELYRQVPDSADNKAAGGGGSGRKSAKGPHR